MSTISMEPIEFHYFRKLFLLLGLPFTCIIKKSIYFVTANTDSLVELGYNE